MLFKRKSKPFYILKKLPKGIFKLLDKIIPKDTNRIVFFSTPNFTDNSKTYYDYIKRNHNGEYRLVWIFDDNSYLKNDYRKKFESYFIHSFSGVWNLIRAKYIVNTHSGNINRYISGSGHKILQLWHGMPIKTIGFPEKFIPKKTLKSYRFLGEHEYFFVTSDIFKNIMASCFRADFSKMYITGQPRTDLCFERNKEINDFFSFDKYKKVIMYLPTYKEVKRSKVKEVEAELKNIFYMDDYNDVDFNRYISDNEILFLLKPHPFDEKYYIELRDKGLIPENVKLILNSDLVNRGFHLYQMFNYVDLLITDFSSVAIDFMILNRPIIYLANLTEQYINNRGFLFNENLERIFIGDKVCSFKELLKAMEENLTEDSWKAEREAQISLMHKYLDDSACKRVYDIMTKL